jgi:hypothetical protein
MTDSVIRQNLPERSQGSLITARTYQMAPGAPREISPVGFPDVRRAVTTALNPLR